MHQKKNAEAAQVRKLDRLGHLTQSAESPKSKMLFLVLCHQNFDFFALRKDVGLESPGLSHCFVSVHELVLSRLYAYTGSYLSNCSSATSI